MLSDVFRASGGSFVRFTIRDAIDILIVAFVIYRVIYAIQGTRAITLVKGLAVIFASSVVARALDLRTISWLLEKCHHRSDCSAASCVLSRAAACVRGKSAVASFGRCRSGEVAPFSD